MFSQNSAEEIDEPSHKQLKKCLPFSFGKPLNLARRYDEKQRNNQYYKVGVRDEIRLMPTLWLWNYMIRENF